MPRSNRSQTPTARAGEIRTLAGLIAGGLILGGVATSLLGSVGEWLAPPPADAEASTSAASNAPASAPASTSTATKAGATVAAEAQSPGSDPKSASGAPAAKPATARKGKAAMPGAVVQSSQHLDDQVAYQYNALGRRDPFQSLLGGEYVGSDVGGNAPPDVGGMKVVGIVWGDADQFALVEDARGDSHILRRGDKVMNGFVESLYRDAIIVNLTLDGQSQSVRVPLTRKGDKANANR